MRKHVGAQRMAGATAARQRGTRQAHPRPRIVFCPKSTQGKLVNAAGPPADDSGASARQAERAPHCHYWTECAGRMRWGQKGFKGWAGRCRLALGFAFILLERIWQTQRPLLREGEDQLTDSQQAGTLPGSSLSHFLTAVVIE